MSARSVMVTASFVLLTACTPIAPVTTTHPAENPEATVDKLFTVDGCTVYRFQDGYSRYFVRCLPPASTAQMSGTECHWVSTGKGGYTSCNDDMAAVSP